MVDGPKPQLLTKEIAQELMRIKGEVRGAVLRVDWRFILEREGKEGLKKLEAKMAEVDFPLKYNEIKPMDFYPIGLDVISMLAVKELFGFNEKNFEEMGTSTVKFSLPTKIFMKYFASLRLVFLQIPEIWQRHYSVGELRMDKFDEEKKYAILKLEKFHVHPVYCPAFGGYFSRVAGMIVKSPVTWEETKCTFRGDKHHEFLFKW